MKTLLVLRHAKAAPNSPTGGDRDRPLSDRGRCEAPLMGEMVRRADVVPDRVLCSSAVRSRQSAELLLRDCGFAGQIELFDELYLADADRLIDLVRKQTDGDRILIVGHSPGLETMIGNLIDSPNLRVFFPTAALARIDFDLADWSHIRDFPGDLVWLINPALLQTI